MFKERQKVSSQQPKVPSLILWLMAGVMALLGGILLFWLHIHQLMGPLQDYDIHLLSVSPLLIWLILLSLRGWLYNMAFHRYCLGSEETEYKPKRGYD